VLEILGCDSVAFFQSIASRRRTAYNCPHESPEDEYVTNALTILVGLALIVYGVRGLRRRQIGFSIGPLLTTLLTGAAGKVFSLACVLGGGVLALPLLIAILSQQPTDTLFLQIMTNSGLPIVGMGFALAIFIQMAIDLGQFIGKHRNRPEA
jgi:hypothetical protein